MSRHRTTLSSDYFARLYAADPDPWQFRTSPYEQAKYAATLAALPKARYVSALEVGCSIGVLTAALAERCSSLLAIDAVEAPLMKARQHCGEKAGIRFARHHVPAEWPAGTFDLILLSEVVYYLDLVTVARLAERVEASLVAGGDVVLVHWTGLTDYPLSGDEAVEAFIEASKQFSHLSRQQRTEHYRLDVLQRGQY